MSTSYKSFLVKKSYLNGSCKPLFHNKVYGWKIARRSTKSPNVVFMMINVLPISILGTTAMEWHAMPKKIIITAARTHFFMRKGAYRCSNSLYNIPWLGSSSFFPPKIIFFINLIKKDLYSNIEYVKNTIFECN